MPSDAIQRYIEVERYEDITMPSNKVKELARAICESLPESDRPHPDCVQAERILREALRPWVNVSEELTAEVADIAEIPEYIPGDIELCAAHLRDELAGWKGGG